MAEHMPDLTYMMTATTSRVSQYGDSLAHLSRFNVGELVLQSGRLVVCDPFGDLDESPFVEQMPRGTHPVMLCVADLPDGLRVVAYSILHLSAKEPVTWEVAHVISSPEPAMPDYISVESGTACYLDADAFPLLIAKFDPTNPADPFRPWLAQELYGDQGDIRIGTATLELSNKPRLNVVLFETGWGNDCYRSYLGRDATGVVCCILTDFSVIDAASPATSES